MKIELKDLTVYAFCDPAGERRNQVLKQIRARSAIVVVGVDALRRVVVLDAWAEKCTPERLVKKIEEVQQRYHPKIFGIEANAMQSLFASLVRAKFREAGIKAAITPVNQSTRIDKDYRIVLAIQPVLAQGRLIVHKSQMELITELRGFPTYATKDIVDALASVIALTPARTQSAIARDSATGLKKYLSRSGAPESYIRKKVAELGKPSGRTADSGRSERGSGPRPQ